MCRRSLCARHRRRKRNMHKPTMDAEIAKEHATAKSSAQFDFLGTLSRLCLAPPIVTEINERPAPR